MASGFWQGFPQLGDLADNLKLLKAVLNELEVIGDLRAEQECAPERKPAAQESSRSDYIRGLVRANGGETMRHMEDVALGVAKHVQATMQSLLRPLEGVVEGDGPWEDLAAVSRFRDRKLKLKRNRKRRQKKRQEAAEFRNTAPERFQQAEQRADEWRAREVAKDVARIKMKTMNELALKKVKAEKHQIEEELKMALMVDKLQELRSARLQKLKKQGHLVPEEDDKFMERVRAAVEEEERQASLAAAEADPSTSHMESTASHELQNPVLTGNKSSQGDDLPEKPQQAGPSKVDKDNPRLPAKFHRYYYGSTTDMERLIEVRRGWDTYLCLGGGGSRVPGHWVEPSPPSSDIWASYLKKKDEV